MSHVLSSAFSEKKSSAATLQFICQVLLVSGSTCGQICTEIFKNLNIYSWLLQRHQLDFLSSAMHLVCLTRVFGHTLALYLCFLPNVKNLIHCRIFEQILNWLQVICQCPLSSASSFVSSASLKCLLLHTILAHGGAGQLVI